MPVSIKEVLKKYRDLLRRRIHNFVWNKPIGLTPELRNVVDNALAMDAKLAPVVFNRAKALRKLGLKLLGSCRLNLGDDNSLALGDAAFRQIHPHKGAEIIAAQAVNPETSSAIVCVSARHDVGNGAYMAPNLIGYALVGCPGDAETPDHVIAS